MPLLRLCDVAGQGPGNKGIGVAVTQAMLGLQEANDFHVLGLATTCNDLLPLGNGLAVFLLNRRKVRRGTLAGPWWGHLCHLRLQVMG